MSDLDQEKDFLNFLMGMADTVISVNELTWEDERNQLVEQMWKQIKNRIDKGDENEIRIAISFLAVCLKRTIGYSINIEDFHIVIENVNKYLIDELITRENK